MILGIDLGSRNVKVVVMDYAGEIKFLKKFDTVKFYRENGKLGDGKLLVDLKNIGIDFEIDKIVSTGYGRNNLNVNNGEKISELKAHSIGAVSYFKIKDFTLLDIGGQDTKVIRVENGKMSDFYTNDKCAAGSGRYLENMANILGISVEELASYYENAIELNNTCAIFGESELIGKIVEGYSLESICAGINMSVFKRTEGFLKKYPDDALVFTGGVAKNKAIIKIIEQETRYKIYIPENPEYTGAIGCCLYAIQKK